MSSPVLMPPATATAEHRAPAPVTILLSLTHPQPVTTEHIHEHSSLASSSSRPPIEAYDSLEWGTQLNGPAQNTPKAASQVENQTIELSTIPSNTQENVTSVAPSLWSPYMNRWRAAACLSGFFTQGLNDSVTGALLPYIEKQYRVSYTVISLLFMARAIGFLAAGPLTQKFIERFGRSKTLGVSAVSNAVAFALILPRPPYPVVVLAFFLSGFNLATISAQNNVFVINLQGGTVLLGFMQGFYGIGGIVAPFVATLMVSHGAEWSYFYVIMLVLSMTNAIVFFWAFRGYESEETTIAMTRRTAPEARSGGRREGVLKKALTNKTTLLGGLLIAAYEGAEVSVSGWVISFLISYRHGDPAHVGYVTSGFWGGITLGRFLLVMPAHKIGDRISLAVLTLATIGFQIMVWFMPNIVGNAVAVAIIGLLQGPVFPCAASVIAQLLPLRLQVTSLGIVTGMGSSGGALGPFITGLLAEKLGTIVFNPVCVTLYVIMLASWVSLPVKPKRTL